MNDLQQKHRKNLKEKEKIRCALGIQNKNE